MKNPFSKKQKNEYDGYEDSYEGGFYRGEEEDGIVGDFDEEAPAAPVKKSAPAGNGKGFKVVTPRGYNDGPAIADYLIDGFTVVLNIEEIDKTAALRLIDFLLGALQVLGGGMRRVTKTTLVLSPHAEDLSDEEEDEEEE